jgi:hypothetical protein
VAKTLEVIKNFLPQIKKDPPAMAGPFWLIHGIPFPSMIGTVLDTPMEAKLFYYELEQIYRQD